MRDLVEVEIGGIVKHGDESYVCVKDDPETLCNECAFYGYFCCARYICSRSNRKDGYSVHFVEQEGGDK